MRLRLPRPIVRILGAFVLGTTVTGCGQNLVAPDSIVEGSGAEAFLDRIDKHCGNHRLGIQTLTYILNFSQDDAYFLDISSKLYHGKIDRQTYADDINGNYPAGANRPAIDCIFSQLDGG
jgi:hypothetical protein